MLIFLLPLWGSGTEELCDEARTPEERGGDRRAKQGRGLEKGKRGIEGDTKKAFPPPKEVLGGAGGRKGGKGFFPPD